MRTRYVQILTLLLVFTDCVEPFDSIPSLNPEPEAEDILVVEATITDRVQVQEVRLSIGGTFLDENDPLGVTAGEVSIEVDDGTIIEFSHIGDGVYRSNEVFGAESNNEYQLRVHYNGDTYISESEELPPIASIEDVYAQRMVNAMGTDGVGIFVDATVNGNTPLFRYQFEETYKIIAPEWNPQDLIFEGVLPPYEFRLVQREQEERVCFGIRLSNDIVQSEGQSLQINQLNGILVHFIPKDDPILQHRYSILIRQLSQGVDAFSFYRLLKEQSTSNNVFTDIQPGFIEGNLKNLDDTDELVIGYFEVAQEDTRRLFFNFADIFPGEDAPPYFINCNFPSAPPPLTPGLTSPLRDAIASGNFVYAGDNNGRVEGGGPYLMVRRPCGDCTALGSNIVPDFWEE